MIDNVEIKIDKDFSDGEISPLLFGSFAEHMGRCIYGGIYDETKGVWREDVLSLVRELKVPIVRYPGGNFVSGYCWKDGIGPKEKRPKKLNLAWRQLEPNEVGVLEFADWAERAGTEIMMCVNLGTGTAQEAAELVEYCNAVPGSYWSDRRVEDGRKEPLKIRYWCLGNEMDGDWQICHMTAEEYARKVVEAAKLMKRVDPSIRLIACGSSAHAMKTCPEWDRIVLEHLYDFVDFISLHQYYGRHTGTNDDFFASYLDFERYIDDIAATCDYVRAVKKSDKTLKLSFDEWNVLNAAVYDGENCEYYILSSHEIIFEKADGVMSGTAYFSRLDLNGDFIRLQDCYVTFYDGEEILEATRLGRQTVTAATGWKVPEKVVDPVKEGFIFVGWVLEDGSTFDFNAVVPGGLNVLARWEKDSNYVENENEENSGTEEKKGCGSAASFVSVISAALVLALVRRKNSD